MNSIASVSEKRRMKKTAQQEHAYTGYVPSVEELEDVSPKRYPPILGFTGFQPNRTDRIGTTFSNAYDNPYATNTSSAYKLNKKQLSVQEADNGGNYIKGKPKSNSNFDRTNPCKLNRNIENSCSEVNKEVQSKAYSSKSGYDHYHPASDYGDFHTLNSRYGHFDAVSGYGDFQAPTSGYGHFDAGSDYGDFLPPNSDNEEYLNSCEYADDCPPSNGSSNLKHCGPETPKHIGNSNTQTADSKIKGFNKNFSHVLDSKNKPRTTSSDFNKLLVHNEVLQEIYMQVAAANGGREGVVKFWNDLASSLTQRYRKRTELLQILKRNFEMREIENGGRMTKEHLKEALGKLSFAITDNQIIGIMAEYDKQCTGTVSMDSILSEISTRL